MLSASEGDYSPDVSEYEPSDSELSSSEEDTATPKKKIRFSHSSEGNLNQSHVIKSLPSTSAKRMVFLDYSSTDVQLISISESKTNIDDIIEQAWRGE